MNIKKEALINEEMMHSSLNESIQMSQETEHDDDPIIKEIDVYLSKTLSNNIFILQV